DTLSRIVFLPPVKDDRHRPSTRVHTHLAYQPVSASLPVFSSSEAPRDWVQLLKNRMNKDLSLTDLF
ncbi:MAG: hypothetical protein ACOYKD_08585, partial [Anaerolineaceae bacterium]